MTQRDEGHDYRDSKNKAEEYEKKLQRRDNFVNIFDEWLDNCPYVYKITKPSMNINDDKIVVEFNIKELRSDQ
tara:strand:+ start:323 stop:541 length:219 start_codon:yes stop_codon:yes gene_type:complete